MDILKSIPILTDDDKQDEPVMTLEDILKIHPSLTLEDSLTFKIFITHRPDLSKEEYGIYMQIIDRLQNNERIRYETAMKGMIAADY
jgi:hypothetical protein